MKTSRILLCVTVLTFVGSVRSQWGALLSDMAEGVESGIRGAADAAEGAETLEPAENWADLGDESRFSEELEPSFNEGLDTVPELETDDQIQQDKKKQTHEEMEEKVQNYEEEEKEFREKAKTEEGEDKELDEETAEAAKKLAEEAKKKLEEAVSDSESTTTKEGLAYGFYYNQMEALRKKSASRLSYTLSMDKSTTNPSDIFDVKYTEGGSHIESPSANINNRGSDSNSHHNSSSASGVSGRIAIASVGTILAVVILVLQVYIWVKKCKKATKPAHSDQERIVSP